MSDKDKQSTAEVAFQLIGFIVSGTVAAIVMIALVGSIYGGGRFQFGPQMAEKAYVDFVATNLNSRIYDLNSSDLEASNVLELEFAQAEYEKYGELSASIAHVSGKVYEQNQKITALESRIADLENKNAQFVQMTNLLTVTNLIPYGMTNWPPQNWSGWTQLIDSK